MREMISPRKAPFFRRSTSPREFLAGLHPWIFTNLLGGSILLAGIISLVWSSDVSWTAHSKPGHERAGILGTSDRDPSLMECGDRKASHMAEVAGIR